MTSLAHLGKYAAPPADLPALHEGAGSLFLGPIPASNENQLDGDARVELRWMPFPNIHFTLTYECPLHESEPHYIPHRLKLPISGQTSCALLGTLSQHDGSRFVRRLDGHLTDGMLVGDDCEVGQVDFHLINFPEYSGTSVRVVTDTHERQWGGRLTLAAEPWTIEIDSVEERSELDRELRTTGGFAVTNVGAIRRTDGAHFTRVDAIRLCDRLRLLLSLVAGGWSSPSMLLGKDEDGTILWEWWQTPGVTPWNRMWSWLPQGVVVDGYIEVPDLGRPLRGLLALTEDVDGLNTVRRAIRWQVEAASSEPDTGIVVAQAGLELVAWARLVGEGRWTDSAFKDANAETRIRALLDLSGIPLEVPPRFWHLREAVAGSGMDAATAITRARNSIVHPVEKEPFLKRVVRVDAHRVSLQLLELTLLNWIDFDGSYADRSDFHAIERVPWGSEHPPTKQ